MDGKSSVMELDFMHSLNLGLKFIMVILVVILSSLALIFVHDFVTQNAYFALKTINVSGARVLSNSEVLVQAGIKPGDNILAINLRKAKNLLIVHPWIRNAAVSRQFPSTISISVIEEKAIAISVIDDGTEVLLNMKGQPFKRFDPATDTLVSSLPKVQGLRLESIDHEYGFKGKLLDAVMAVLSLQHIDKIDRIDEIDADIDVGVEVITRVFEGEDGVDNDPVTMKLGFEGFETKLKNVGQIIDYMQISVPQKRLRSIDMFDIRSVIVTLEDKDILPGIIKGGV